MEKIRKPPSFNPFDAGNNKLQPPGVRGRSAPFSRLKVMADPRETAQSTVQQVTARVDLTPAEQVGIDRPLPVKASAVPGKAVTVDDDITGSPPQRS
jgi:hypothetical protein